MILFQNGLITLDYNPATDLLHVEWPQFQEYAVSEARHALQVMVETIRNYDIKKLFLDTRQVQVDVSDAEYMAVLREFGADLANTRLSKVSRMVATDHNRERNVQSVKEQLQLSFPLMDFTDQDSALEWLLAE
ncbi:hypothetical protein [Pontibacter akesuensis]|uniref:SpoIIAA-like n=1 Tax=Pontibacter akesuensis TaxID=388950 RepID=A0A1I7IDQ7_9BACT|nr:hypothetical protein [Pontibacter akesuensis]GHA66658.1 hypothetical protein GCM10007389_19650 [Pontibacter akesuensis]SFU71064.1 hypothetical protein SAMN04487941_2132 [Pontibacter akesuensis]